MPIFRGKNIVSAVSDYKDSVRVVARTNYVLADDVYTIDQINLADQDRVLLVAQQNPVQNGIYVWSADTHKLTRSRDADSAFELSAGVKIYVEEGVTNAKTTWVITTPGIINPGLTNISIAKENTVSTGTQAGNYGNAKKTLLINVDETGIITSVTEADIDVDGGNF